MAIFRRVKNVPTDAVNLAYVAVPEKSADELVKIEGVIAGSNTRRGKIMYADLSGRLRTSEWSSIVSSSHPVVTDLFYDKDRDKVLDAYEALPEYGLSYYYKARKYFYGKRAFQYNDAYLDYVVTSGTAGSVTSGGSTFTDSTKNWTTDSLIGLTLKITDASYTVGSRYFLITDNNATTLTVEDSFSASLSSLDYQIIDTQRSTNNQFSLGVGHNVSLVDANGDAYRGTYTILIEPVYPTTKAVTLGTTEYALEDYENMTCFIVHLYLDRNDEEVWLKFDSGDLEASGEDWVPVDVELGHTEKVTATEFFRYFPVATVIDPINAGRKIVASQPTPNGSYIYTTDKAVIEKRPIDTFSWRIKVTTPRTTTATAFGRDTLNVGVIGYIPNSLSTFLNSDYLWKWRMDISNPFPVGSKGGADYWNIQETASEFDWSKYDLVIVRTSNLHWNELSSKLLQVTAPPEGSGSPGMVIIDMPTAYPRFIDATATSDMLKISFTDSGVGTRIAYGEFCIKSSLFQIEEGYYISEQDVIQAAHKAYEEGNVSTWYAECAFIDAETEVTRSNANKILIAKENASLPDPTKAYMVQTAKERVVVSTLGFTNMDNDACKQIFCNLVWGFGSQEPNSATYTYNRTITQYTPWEGSWVAGMDKDAECILTSWEMSKYKFREVEEPSTGDKRYIRQLSDKGAEQICLEKIPRFRRLTSNSSTAEAVYELEIAGHNGFVACNSAISKTQIPEAWSTRTDIESSWNPGPAYKVAGFTELASTTGMLPTKPPAPFTVGVQIVGKRIDADSFTFSWATSQDFSYETTTSSTRTEYITNSSGLIKYVTTWSDKEWTAIAIDQSPHNPCSSYNLHHYGGNTAVDHRVTAHKYYPWDGQTHYIKPGSTGHYVKYIQRALNELIEIDKGPLTGKLKVDGIYGWKTYEAVHSYQTRWDISHDGVVDAGTAGHIMRAANNDTDWDRTDDVWKKYGSCKNMTDENPDTMHGRRTWINTQVINMTDTVYIYLEDGVRVKKVKFRPYLLGDGAADYLHVYKIGGRLHKDHSEKIWALDKSNNMTHGIKAKSGDTRTYDLNIMDKVDALYFSFLQNNSFNGDRCRMWALSKLHYEAIFSSSKTITKSETVTQPKITLTLFSGGTATFTLDETTPAFCTFKGWKKTTAQIAADIKASLEPAIMQDYIDVTVTEVDNKIKITFTATQERTDAEEILLGSTCKIKVNPLAHNAWDDDTETGSITSVGTNLQVIDSGKTWTTNALSGSTVEITSGSGDNQKRYIQSNSGTTLTLTSAFTTIPQVGDTYRIVARKCSHWPAMINKDNPDAAYQIRYTARVVDGANRASGVFFYFPEWPQTMIGNIFSQITASEIEKLGIDKIRVGVLNRHIETPQTIGQGADRYPVRYAMKPFCVTETSSSQVLDIGGLTGDQPSEIWGIRIEASTIVRDLVISRDSFVSHTSDINRVTEDYEWLLSASGMQDIDIQAVYSLSSMQYSATYGEPYVTRTGELAVWTDAANEIQVAKSPLLVLDNGTSPITLHHGTATLAVKSFDVATGKIEFTVSSGTVNIGDAITVDYTYRESYMDYVGSTSGGSDIFDVCPYEGHVMNVDGSTYDTYTLVGKPIYVYLLPTILNVGTQYRYNDRCVYHTLRSDIFNETSEYYNPLAIKVATVIIQDDGTGYMNKPLIIDTRSGGGGLIESEIDNVRKTKPALAHSSGFNELDSLYDYGHLDGTAYLKGGTVILKLPPEWRSGWIARGLTEKQVDEMVESFAERWLPPGKTLIYSFDDMNLSEYLTVSDTVRVTRT